MRTVFSATQIDNYSKNSYFQKIWLNIENSGNYYNSQDLNFLLNRLGSGDGNPNLNASGDDTWDFVMDILKFCCVVWWQQDKNGKEARKETEGNPVGSPGKVKDEKGNKREESRECKTRTVLELSFEVRWPLWEVNWWHWRVGKLNGGDIGEILSIINAQGISLLSLATVGAASASRMLI